MLGDRRIGFIGGGMMAQAAIKGLIGSGMEPGRIIASDPLKDCRDRLSSELGISVSADNAPVAESADIIVIATKPHIVHQAVSEMSGVLNPEQLLISMAAGVTIKSIETLIPVEMPVIRAMPNTPALVGEGATAIAPGKCAADNHMDLAAELFGAFGIAVRLTEDKLDAVTGLSGSGPAYVYTFIESLADGGVRMGLPKSVALVLAAQTVLGAATMVMQTGEHPAVLRDKVMTPGGTTIAGMTMLEKSAFRSALIEAVTAATERSADLSKPKKD